MNTSKGANIGIELKEYKDALLIKNVMRHKMRRIQSKKTKLEHTKSIKYHYRVLMIKKLF